METGIKIVNPPNVFDPSASGYAHVAIPTPENQQVYIAGQTGSDKNGVFVEGLEAQAKVMAQNVKECLSAAGATIRNVVHFTLFVVNYDHQNVAFFAALQELFTDEAGFHRVPSTLVPVPCLASPEALIEMNVIASVPTPRSQPGGVAHTVTTTDVVIVGAGLSGLQAATDLQAQGISYVVLEARDRVGGKTYSKPVEGGKSATESGAAWINNTTQPKMYAYSQKFGLDVIVQYIEGREVLTDKSGNTMKYPFGELPLSEEDGAMLAQTFQVVDTEAQKIDIHDCSKNSWFEDMPLSQWLRRNGLKDGLVKDFVTIFVRALLGVEPEEISALYFLDYVKSGLGLESLMTDGPSGAQHMRIRQGMQSVSVNLAAQLHPGTVRLNTPVHKIQQHGNNHCVVFAAGNQQFHAKRVIVSIPTPLYKTIQFDPPLPANKQELADSTFLGDYSKFTLIYQEPWWRKLGYSGSFADLRGPVAFSRDTSSEADGQYSITFFVVGEDSRKWSRLSLSDRKESIVKQFKEMTSPEGLEHIDKIIDIREFIWMKEAWSQGGPCPVPGPGIWERLGNNLREPHGNIHFVGTETAFEWKGYMEGALTSGERGASEVAAALKPRDKL